MFVYSQKKISHIVLYFRGPLKGQRSKWFVPV